jgi:Prokaryotic E2 family E
VTEEQAIALQDVQATFPQHRVDYEETEDGGLWVVVREVTIGPAWNREVIDVSVKLQVTFPSTLPYPFYCEPGLARTDGQSFPPVQPDVDIGGGIRRTQISLRIVSQQRFDTENETVGARFVAVIAWLRNPH